MDEQNHLFFIQQGNYTIHGVVFVSSRHTKIERDRIISRGRRIPNREGAAGIHPLFGNFWVVTFYNIFEALCFVDPF